MLLYLAHYIVSYLLTRVLYSFSFFFFNDTATTEIYTLSLHDALPIFSVSGPNAIPRPGGVRRTVDGPEFAPQKRSEEHTSELQSQSNLVCRLLLEKKKKKLTHFLIHISTNMLIAR